MTMTITEMLNIGCDDSMQVDRTHMNTDLA
jgi:hypothetical protein